MNNDSVAQDATGFSVLKRPGVICRYFLNSGDCLYGSKCQYSHEMPTSRTSAIATADSQPQVTDEGSYYLYHILLYDVIILNQVAS